MRKALVTGVAGQDGTYLAEFLLESGYEIYGTDNNAVGLAETEALIKKVLTRNDYSFTWLIQQSSPN